MKSVKNKLHFTKCIIHVFFKMYTCDEHDDTHVFMTLDAYDIMILNVITFMQLNHSYKDNICCHNKFSSSISLVLQCILAMNLSTSFNMLEIRLIKFRVQV